ncbi:MAG: sigma-E factor regulatory protein RseB domain-containing protein [Lacisediminihabitans sp.]
MQQLVKRWAPALAISAVIAGVALVAPLAANASSGLPSTTPAHVLELVQHSHVSALSGTIKQSADLGIPQLPSGLAGSHAGLSSALELLTGSHTTRVFIDGPTKARVQVLDKLAERDVIRNGNDVWLYSSDDQTATHLTLPAKADHSKSGMPQATQTPAQLATRFLAAIDPSTTVTVDKNVTIAGRAAYVLVLTPRTSDTLVGSVSIAVDGETGLPLSVAVTPRGQSDAALSVAFTKLSIGAPDAGLFSFTPPKGSTVKDQPVKEQAKAPTTKAPDASTHPATHVTGSGWASIVEFPASKLPTSLTESTLLGELSTSVAGGRLLHTSLVNILLTPDGRAFVGSVPAAALQAAASNK